MGGLGGPGITLGARSCDPIMGSLCAPGQSPLVASRQGTCNKEGAIRAEPAAGGDPSFVITQIRLPQNVGIRVLKDDLVGRRPVSQEC